MKRKSNENIENFAETLEDEIPEDEFHNGINALVRRQHSEIGAAAGKDQRKKSDGAGAWETSFASLQDFADHAQFLPFKTAENTKTLVFAAGLAGPNTYSVAMVEPENIHFITRVSRSLYVFNPSALTIETISENEFKQIFQIVYSRQDLTSQNGGGRRQSQHRRGRSARRDRKSDGGELISFDWGGAKNVEADLLHNAQILDPSKVISQNEPLWGRRLGLTNWDWYYDILERVENDEIDYTATDTDGGQGLSTLQFAAFILMDGLRFGASDFHFQCHGATGIVRYRRQNVMYSRFTGIHYDLYIKICNSMCQLAGKDSARLTREPVESVLKLQIFNSDEKIKNVQFRFESVDSTPHPTVNLRAQPNPITDITKIGYFPFQIGILSNFLELDNGMGIITGATGSGKTNTQHSLFSMLQKDYIYNVLEFARPIEIESAFRVQVSLRDFADPEMAQKHLQERFKASLRLDPDAVAFGETREFWEAMIALDAANTGHLVFTTMHSASVEETLVRILQMGVPRDQLATLLSFICSQKLVKKLCSVCRVPDDKLSLLAAKTVWRESGILPDGKPCLKCQKTGFFGMTAVAEILPLNGVGGDEIGAMLKKGASPSEIVTHATESGLFQPFKKIGVLKVLGGETSESQVRTFSGDFFNDPMAFGFPPSPAADDYRAENDFSSSAASAVSDAPDEFVEADFEDVIGIEREDFSH